jgi:excisionase family DNA binding protein
MRVRVRKRGLTVGDVARMLDVSPETLRHWIRQGRVRPDARTLGGHARFSRESAEKLARHCVRAA